ncbi:hypothetical protein Tco_0278138 [Tanacetum coccineum]
MASKMVKEDDDMNAKFNDDEYTRMEDVEMEVDDEGSKVILCYPYEEKSSCCINYSSCVGNWKPFAMRRDWSTSRTRAETYLRPRFYGEKVRKGVGFQATRLTGPLMISRWTIREEVKDEEVGQCRGLKDPS